MPNFILYIVATPLCVVLYFLQSFCILKIRLFFERNHMPSIFCNLCSLTRHRQVPQLVALKRLDFLPGWYPPSSSRFWPSLPTYDWSLFLWPLVGIYLPLHMSQGPILLSPSTSTFQRPSVIDSLLKQYNKSTVKSQWICHIMQIICNHLYIPDSFSSDPVLCGFSFKLSLSSQKISPCF